MIEDELLSAFQDVNLTVRRHIKKILLFNGIVALVGLTVILCWPRKYGSEAKLWLKLGRENSRIDPAAATGETVQVMESGREDEVKSVLDVICSRGVLSQVVDKMTPAVVLGDLDVLDAEADEKDAADEKPSPVQMEDLQKYVGRAFRALGGAVASIDPVSDRERAIREVSENVYADAERKSNVIMLSYKSESPELARSTLQRIIEQYQLQHAKIHHSIGTLEFFDEQRDELKAKVEFASRELTDLMKTEKIASIEGQRKNLEAEMLHVQTAKITTESEVSKAKALVDELSSLLTSHPQYIKSEEKLVPNTGRDELQKTLYEMQIQRMQLEAKHAGNHPLVKRAREQEKQAVAKLSEATTMSRNEVSEALNLVHQDLALKLATAKADRFAHEATLKSIVRHEQALIDKIAKLNVADIAIRQKQRELTLAEENYMAYAKSVEDARINDALTNSAISNIAIAQEPTFQEKPVSPSKALVVMMSAACMFFGTIVLICYLRIKDSSSFSREIAALTEAKRVTIEDAMKLGQKDVRVLILHGELSDEKLKELGAGELRQASKKI